MEFVAPDAAQVTRVRHKLVLHGLMVGTQNPPSSKNAEHFLALLGEGHHSTLPLLHGGLSWVGGHPLPPAETGHVQLMDRVVVALSMAAVATKGEQTSPKRGVSVPVGPQRRCAISVFLLPQSRLGIEYLHGREKLRLLGTGVGLGEFFQAASPHVQFAVYGRRRVSPPRSRFVWPDVAILPACKRTTTQLFNTSYSIRLFDHECFKGIFAIVKSARQQSQ